MMSSPDDHKQDKKVFSFWVSLLCQRSTHLEISNLRKMQKSLLDAKKC